MIKHKRFAALTATSALVLAGACAPAAEGSVTLAARPASINSSLLNGAWLTDGYGTIVVITGHTMQTYDTTAISCLRNDLAGTAAGSGASRGSRRFTDNDGTVSTFTAGARPGQARWHIDANLSDRILRRLPRLPARCTRPTPDTPAEAFEIFWHTMAENYPFFARRGVSWPRVYRTYRPRVTAHTTRTQLLAIFADMIRPLHDEHVGIVAGQTVVAFDRPGTVIPTPQLDARARALVERADLQHALRTWCRGRIGYASLPGHLGYLRISGFTGYTEPYSFAANAAALRHALDAIFTTARTAGPGRLRGLVIDLRPNGGGGDPLGLAIAARLTGRTFFGYAKQARNDPARPGRFTAPQPFWVRPARAPRYTGPVVILAGGSTVSAGETFTQAMLQRTPRPVLIGENTQGVFSDLLTRQLPNGWWFGLPNEEYLTPSGRTYDITGIAPAVRIPVLTAGQFAAGRDPAFRAAVAILDRARSRP
ncbi:MAG TPA: S41 family peptidase [Streptosporangiaceae bacterium]